MLFPCCIFVNFYHPQLACVAVGSASGFTSKIAVRITGFSQITNLRSLRANIIGSFVSIRGTVIRTGNIKPFLLKVNYRCVFCETQFTKTIKDGMYGIIFFEIAQFFSRLGNEQMGCPSCKTAPIKRPLEIVRDSPKLTEYQIIRYYLFTHLSNDQIARRNR